MKNKIWAIINIISPIIMFIILVNNNMSEKFVNIITLSLFIGWIFPFLNLLINGLSMLIKINTKMSIFFNIISFILNILLIIAVVLLYDKNLITILIEYIIIAIINLVNIIINIYKYHQENKNVKRLLKEEYSKIKQIKKNNNGIIK